MRNAGRDWQVFVLGGLVLNMAGMVLTGTDHHTLGMVLLGVGWTAIAIAALPLGDLLTENERLMDERESLRRAKSVLSDSIDELLGDIVKLEERLAAAEKETPGASE